MLAINRGERDRWGRKINQHSQSMGTPSVVMTEPTRCSDPVINTRFSAVVLLDTNRVASSTLLTTDTRVFDRSCSLQKDASMCWWSSSGSFCALWFSRSGCDLFIQGSFVQKTTCSSGRLLNSSSSGGMRAEPRRSCVQLNMSAFGLPSLETSWNQSTHVYHSVSAHLSLSLSRLRTKE